MKVYFAGSNTLEYAVADKVLFSYVMIAIPDVKWGGKAMFNRYKKRNENILSRKRGDAEGGTG